MGLKGTKILCVYKFKQSNWVKSNMILTLRREPIQKQTLKKTYTN